ncbi:MAG: sigma factor [Acholeplasmataceae bacterium]|nr:sigma factor [Acholeplasmataceae bacterium]
MHLVMNDYELIYLIHAEHDELALDFMFQKYHKFIWKQVHLMELEPKEHDDFHQEGNLMLNKAIKTFNTDKNKTFTRYFELILKRHFYQLKRSLPTYFLFENTDFCKERCYIEEEPVYLSLNSNLEQIVYERYFMNRETIIDIESSTNFSRKQIYNTIFRIKEKYKIMI